MTKLTHYNSGKVYYIDTDADNITTYLLFYRPMFFYLLPGVVNNWAEVKNRMLENNDTADIIQVHIRGTYELTNTFDKIDTTKSIRIESTKEFENKAKKK
jgi:hypothetical protein